MKSKNPGNNELAGAFSKLEEKLTDFLEKVKDPNADNELLFSFEPLVEGLIAEDKGYCLTAEKTRIRVEIIKSYVCV